MARRLLLLAVAGLVVAHALPADARRPARFRWVPSPGDYQRDKLRVLSVPPLAKDSNLDLPAAEVTRHVYDRFDVRFEDGNVIRAASKHNRLTTLMVVKGSRSLDLLPAQLPILFDHTNDAISEKDRVQRIHWTGPWTKRGLFELFHELGHAAFDERFPRAEVVATHRAGRAYRSALSIEGVRPRLSRNEKRIVIGQERFAWAYALQKVSELKQQGFDLFDDVPMKELKQYVDLSLKTYFRKIELGKGPEYLGDDRSAGVVTLTPDRLTR